jgi:peptide/nickel transport system permease protein
VSETAVDALDLAAPGARRRRPRLSPRIAVAILVLGAVVFLALFGYLVAPVDPHAQDLDAGLVGPSGRFWLGTDDLGRDIFSRTLVGARTALVGPILIALGAMAIGNGFGLLAGYRGGWVDTIVMRAVDLMYALPALLVAIVVGGVLGGGYWVAIAILIVLFSPYDARLVRGATLEQRSLPYVEAARTLGLSPRRIMFRHVWPNLLPLVVANTFLNFAFALVTLAGLSFIGIGVPPGTPDWGQMLADSRTLIFTNPWAALGPGAALVLTAVSMNLVGDWLYEQLSDRGRLR